MIYHVLGAPKRTLQRQGNFSNHQLVYTKVQLTWGASTPGAGLECSLITSSNFCKCGCCTHPAKFLLQKIHSLVRMTSFENVDYSWNVTYPIPCFSLWWIFDLEIPISELAAQISFIPRKTLPTFFHLVRISYLLKHFLWISWTTVPSASDLFLTSSHTSGTGVSQVTLSWEMFQRCFLHITSTGASSVVLVLVILVWCILGSTATDASQMAPVSALLEWHFLRVTSELWHWPQLGFHSVKQVFTCIAYFPHHFKVLLTQPVMQHWQ